jgi:DNA-binding response OmpR family regulator
MDHGFARVAARPHSPEEVPVTLPSQTIDEPVARVLLVEDDFDVRAVLRARLRREGFEVEVAGDGIEAFHLFFASRFHVVVTDLFLPRENGIRLIRALRRRRPLLPVVAISGGGPQGDLSALQVAGAAGAGALLEKPFAPSELVAAVQRVLEPAE